MANPWDKPAANPWDKPAQTSPEQGNMFTQSAQDIQYDPVSGVPLNTSSYGSAPTGATETARRRLTTAAAVPINVATGVAKNVGGLAQTLNRYLGGESSQGNLSKPEEFVNAINQIETGTQQQSGSPNLLKGASMVGQAAPFVMSPMKIGNPTFLEQVGSKIAPAMEAIGSIPSYGNAIKNVGQGMLTGATSSLATPEQVGLSTDEYRNAKNKDLLTQTVLGGGIPVVGAIGSKIAGALRGTKLSPQMETAVANAREAGYTVPPTQAGGGIINRVLEGLAGKASTLQEASVRNQEITDKLAKKSLGLGEDAILSPDLIKNVRDTAGKAYENIGLSGTIKPDATYIENLNKIAAPYIKTAEAFPNAKPSPVIDLVESFKSPSFDAAAAVEKIKQSRIEADDAFAKGRTDVGRASKKIADTIEDSIEKHLETVKQPELLDKFKEARTLIAKTYEVEKAMNKTTGTVNASKLASRLQAGKPMSGELKDIAQFGQAFPRAAQVPERVAGTIGISPLDYTVAGLTGGASLLSGEDKGTSSASALAALLTRPAARKAILSPYMQNRLVQKEGGQLIPQGVKNALPSYDEAKQLAKMLLIQRSGNKPENRNE
jgi:hypothetical protein